MAITNPLATLAQVKAALSITDTSDDTRLELVIGAVSRQLESWCQRVFYDSGSASARSFYADTSSLVRVDDFSTTSGLVVKTDDNDDAAFETTWGAADYQVEPLNGVVDGVPGWPFYRLRAVESRSFPCGRRPLVEVTARWGWAAVPEPVREACIVQTIRIFKRKDSPFGVAGAADFGVMRMLSKLDPDVELMLAPYRKNPIGVA